MTGNNAFNDALDASIDALLRGESLDAVLAKYPHHADELRPLLETSLLVDPSRTYQPPSDHLRDNVSLIKSAVRRSRIGIVNAEQPASRARDPWWNRRLIFASMSLPAGVVAFALIGGGGAAAAGVALTTSIDEEIGSAVSRAAPSWVEPVIPGANGSHAVAQGDEDATVLPTATGLALTPTPSGAPATDVTTVRPDATSATAHEGVQTIDLSGVVLNVRGNTFELTNGETTFKIQTDSNTNIIGELAKGASVDVSGTISGNGNVHADLVRVTATQQAEPPQSPAQPPAASPAAPGLPPGQIGKTKTPPGLADKTSTPEQQAQSTKTPPGQSARTKEPGPAATPPGQGGGNGNGNGGNRGNGN